jgi:serine palmitoyltransferase
MELFLLLVAIRYLLAKAYSPKKRAAHMLLTEHEVDELVDDWTPEPLVPDHDDDLIALAEQQPVLHHDASTGPRTKISTGQKVLNLANHNHFNLSNDPSLVATAVDTIRTYGVGPCSAPGFAGTFDVHLKLEQDIAHHLGTEDTILYSQSFSTISSVISAFCKRGDIIVADRAVNFAIRKGIQASRSIVRWYEHNDMDDLECVLAKLVPVKGPLTRRFIITEGLSENVGDVIDLPRLVAIKNKYKFRIILDETYASSPPCYTNSRTADNCIDGPTASSAAPVAASLNFKTSIQTASTS